MTPHLSRMLISKIYEALKKLDINKANNPINKWGVDISIEFLTEESQKNLIIIGNLDKKQLQEKGLSSSFIADTTIA